MQLFCFDPKATILLGLALHFASASQSVVTLNAVPQCPSDSSLEVLTAVDSAKSLLTCAAKCVTSKFCSAIHFFKSKSKCYHRRTDQLDAISNSETSECRSCTIDVRSNLAVDPSSAPEVTAQPPGQTAVTTQPMGHNIVTMQPPDQTSVTPQPMDQTTATTQPLDQTSVTKKPMKLSTIPSTSGLNRNLLSKLLIFFDFRQGYYNLVNPAKYLASPQGSVSRDSQGAHFLSKSPSNFISVDTDVNSVVPTFLGQNASFSFYARLMRNAEDRQTYHLLYDCSSTVSSRGEFGDENGKIYISHSFPSVSDLPQTKVTLRSVESFFVRNNYAQLASVGAVFEGISEFKLFKDGIMLQNVTRQFAAYSGSPLCLRLGFNSESSYALEGLFVCYAIAKAALTEGELQQLETFCK